MFTEVDDWDVQSDSSEQNPTMKIFATKNPKSFVHQDDDDDNKSDCSSSSSSGFFDIDPYQKDKINNTKTTTSNNSKNNNDNKTNLSSSSPSTTTTAFKQKQFRQPEHVLNELIPQTSSLFEALRQEKKAEKHFLAILSADTSSSASLLLSHQQQQQNNMMMARTKVSGFHKPGDTEFSLVAVPPEHLLNREGGENVAKRDKTKKQQQ